MLCAFFLETPKEAPFFLEMYLIGIPFFPFKRLKK